MTRIIPLAALCAIAFEFAGCSLAAVQTTEAPAPTVIVANRDSEGSLTDDIRVGGISGIEVIDDTLRLYHGGRPGTVFIETKDLQNWSEPTPIQMPEGMQGNTIGVFYHDGWKGYGTVRGMRGMQLFTSPDGITFEHLGTAFNWKMDTFFSMFWDPIANEYRSYGRVRGTAPRDAGGWGDDEPTGRRGISLHSNPTWAADWENKGRIIADPMDYWDYTQDIRPEFYVPNVFIDGNRYRAFTTVMHNNVNRVITNYRNRGPDSTRITGPVYPIELESADGVHFTIVSEEPLVPLEPHLRYSNFPPPWYGEDNTEPTCPDCYEVGQLYPFGRIIEFKGGRYIFYFYRDDTHYEKPANTPVENAIYVIPIVN